MKCAATVFLAAGLLAAPAAMAQDNLEKLSNFQSTGVTDFTFIEQGGEYAEGVRANLERVTLPAGFKIELYAIVPDARHMAVGPQGIVTFVGTRKTKVWSVTDRNKDRIANREALRAELAAVFSRHEAEPLCNRLLAAGLPAECVRLERWW